MTLGCLHHTRCTSKRVGRDISAVGNANLQTCEAGATSQLAESASHDLSGGHSTGIETMDTGTSNLREKTATQLLNEHHQRGNTIRYEEFLCDGHTDHSPQYGCRVWVNGEPKGFANNRSSRKKAKEEAASEAVMTLLLT